MNTKDIFMYCLAGIVIVLIFVVIGILMFRTTPTENSELLYTALGLALGWGTAVIQYFFGSSKGSADKTELLNKNDNT